MRRHISWIGVFACGCLGYLALGPQAAQADSPATLNNCLDLDSRCPAEFGCSEWVAPKSKDVWTGFCKEKQISIWEDLFGKSDKNGKDGRGCGCAPRQFYCSSGCSCQVNSGYSDGGNYNYYGQPNYGYGQPNNRPAYAGTSMPRTVPIAPAPQPVTPGWEQYPSSYYGNNSQPGSAYSVPTPPPSSNQAPAVSPPMPAWPQ